MTISGLFGLGIIILSAILMALLAILHQRLSFSFRNLPGFTRIQNISRLVVEDGSRLHVALGNGDLLTAQGASAFAGLALLRQLGELTSMSDRPTIATTGNGLLNLLAQDTERTAIDVVSNDQVFEMNNARITGFSPFSYAAGVIPIIRDEKISANVLIGSFGPEVSLLIDAAERQKTSVIAASDGITAQAVLFSHSSEHLIGEEIFAAGAYLKTDSFSTASLVVQDLLRWIIIFAMIGGAGLKMAGFW